MDNNQTSKIIRLQSLDALRGFDMFWIISGEGLIHTWATASENPIIDWMSAQLHHSDWNGFTFYDLIFPLFILIAGVSMPYSMGKKLDQASVHTLSSVRQQILVSLLKRTLILILLGMIVNGLLQWKGYENTRFASVLGRIALSCFFAGIIFLYCNLRGQIMWFIGLLISYWILLKLIPVPGFGVGILTPEGNMEAYIDRLLLPGKLHRKVYDPEGLLSTIPAIGNALMGIFVGQFLRRPSAVWTPLKKGIMLLPAGVILILLAWLWNFNFPINKNMWTSSFVLLTCGWSLIILSAFYLVIDVAGFRKWSLPLIWIGMNSITIYMASHGLVNFEYTASFLFGGLIKFANALWQPVWLSTGIILIQLALLYFLYQKKWFLKV